ncbi:MAG TPA: lipase maturation factor family protein, partial [Candidatus Kryptonia bacterium]|nr:lipase maturation factor family protein [Candidatus Kryptonia bacterium]
YMSFIHVGQLFWGYGWEILLLESGFLAMFLCRPFDPRPSAVPRAPIWIVMLLLRWVVFRLMFGAGLIKIHGDPCWRNLTCMIYHYETQPLPNPLSWYFHHFPPVVHRFEVLVNHFVELIVPWTLFGPRRLRQTGGLFTIGFQLLLILSGNLVWLNWLTIVLCIACFDDQALAWLIPARLRDRLTNSHAEPASHTGNAVVIALAALVAYLSIGPVRNLMGSRQIMNGSFDRLHLVNTYGAFGSVGKVRNEIILEGTTDEQITDTTRWRAYEFKCKPGDVHRRPCVVAPYHYRIDWQIWFAAMEDPRGNPWLVHFIYLLLQNDAGALSLLANDPFPDAPPRFIRAELYKYEFTEPGDAGHAWWRRTRVGEYFPPLSLGNSALQRFIEARGWETANSSMR